MTQDPKRVVIVGCGGIGSWLAEAIGRTLEFQAPGSIMVLVDGDNYEEKNIERQFFKRLGNKAQALRDDVQSTIPNTLVVATPAWVVPADQVGDLDEEEDPSVGKISAEDLINEGDHVFAVVDNFAARKLILDAAQKLDDIDVYLGGNGDLDNEPLYATTVHYRRRNGQDITIHPAEIHDEYANPTDRNPGELSCAERAQLEGGTQLLAANLSVVTMLMARVSQTLFGTDEQDARAIENSEVCMDLSFAICAGHDRRTDYARSLEKESQYATA